MRDRKTLFIVVLALFLSAAALVVCFSVISKATGNASAAIQPNSTADSEIQVTNTVVTPQPSPSPTPSPTPEPTPSPTPMPESYQIEFDSSLGDYETSKLVDDNFKTVVSLKPSSTFTLSFEENIYNLYFVWDYYPGEWTLSVGNDLIKCGQNGFLHETVHIPSGASEVTVNISSDESRYALSDLYAFSEGALPDWVQDWDTPCETADILLFPAHSDDEFVFFGGIIPYYAVELGLNVQVAYMTTSYYSFDRERIHESLNGLWTAGLRNYPINNMQEDKSFGNIYEAEYFYGEDSFTSFQVEMIRRFKPIVVVSHDELGEYGHAVHKLAAFSAEEAVVQAADPSFFPDSFEKYGVWDTPKLYLHLYGSADDMTVLNYESASAALGGKTPYEVACEAYKKHVSQQIWRFKVFTFDDATDSHRFGLYRSTVGADILKNDLMENIDLSEFR